ncbi:MAG: helix-turn-helix domain-containing protein [Gemmatimonadetes bacterium]|nr:helix-turn-helix domain-containing protein [Gemmatimonadota bacterium]MBA4159257.1 helix-turn-helix domain-containing protein [Gemmatimonadota bacterium]
MSTRSLLARLQEWPPGALIPVEWVRAQLEAEAGQLGEAHAPETGDLSIEDVARLSNRAPGTVRGWCNSGQLPGAYKLRGRDWRIPRAAYRTFLDRQAEGAAKGQGRDAPVDLSAWRGHIREAG